MGSSDTLLTVTLGLSGRLNGLYNLPSFREREYVRIENVFILELVVWPFGSIVSLEPRRRGNKAAIERNMGAADQIVDSISSTNNNNSNNDGEFDDDLKRVSEVLESSKACVFSNPTFFLDKKIFPLPQNVHQNEALKKTSSSTKRKRKEESSTQLSTQSNLLVVLTTIRGERYHLYFVFSSLFSFPETNFFLLVNFSFFESYIR